MISLCRVMFLHTIGHKTDRIITHFLRKTVNDLPCLEDKRGKANATKMKAIGEENYSIVNEHIESFHPQVSHYTVEHAPNRRYLTGDLTIHQMHKHFVSKYKHISYETYRKIFDKENIGFASPTQDDCGICSLYKQHTHKNIPSNDCNQRLEESCETVVSEQTKENTMPNILENVQLPNEQLEESNCTICIKYQIHKQMYTIARQKYNDDVSRIWDDEQKVLILPEMTLKNSFSSADSLHFTKYLQT